MVFRSLVEIWEVRKLVKILQLQTSESTARFELRNEIMAWWWLRMPKWWGKPPFSWEKRVVFGWMKFGVILILKIWGVFAVFLKQIKAPKKRWTFAMFCAFILFLRTPPLSITTGSIFQWFEMHIYIYIISYMICIMYDGLNANDTW